MRAALLLTAVLLSGCASEEPEPVAVPAGHGGSDVDSAGDRACVDAGAGRDLPEEVFTGSSEVTLAEVRSAAGAAAELDAGPYAGLPPTHPVTACFFFDGQTYTSLLVDAEGRVALNPAAPQG